MGLANFFRKHIPKFAHIAAPLTDLLRGDKSDKMFEFTETAKVAFKDLKDQLSRTVVLTLPDFSKNFRITTDASKYACGMMLSQIDEKGNERPVAFES
jgi:hypothetical protein